MISSSCHSRESGTQSEAKSRASESIKHKYHSRYDVIPAKAGHEAKNRNSESNLKTASINHKCHSRESGNPA